MNPSAFRIAAASVALTILIGAWLMVRNLPGIDSASVHTTTTVGPTLPDTVATLPSVTDPQVGTSFGK